MKAPENREFVVNHNYVGTWTANDNGILADFKKADGGDDQKDLPAGKRASPNRSGAGYATNYMRSTNVSTGPYPTTSRWSSVTSAAPRGT